MNACAALAVAAGCAAALSAGLPPPAPLKQGAVAFYDANCAHCHGPGGSGYGKSFLARRDLNALRQELSDMADGPGQSSLSGVALAAQTAYHQALIARAPFLDWTSWSGGVLGGEVSRGATVAVRLGKRSVKALVKPAGPSGSSWSARLPHGAAPSQARVVATLKGRSQTLDLSKRAFSLPAPWPPK